MVALSNLVSAQGPLVLGLGQKGLGLRVWGQGLTIFLEESFPFLMFNMDLDAIPFFIIFLERLHLNLVPIEIFLYFC